MSNSEWEHHDIQTNGVCLHCVQAGPKDGPLVILLHGFPEFWYGWRKQMPALVEAGYRVWAPDQRGYNLSEKPKPAWRDGHFNSQSNILTQNLISYDFIGKFENFENDFLQALRRLDADTETIRIAQEMRNTTPETHASWAFDGELADLAYGLYREDFEAFKYEKDSWMFPEK